MVTRHDPRLEPRIVMSRSQVLILAFRSPTDIDGVETRGEGQAAEGKDIREEEWV
jgi:hypothetical protein